MLVCNLCAFKERIGSAPFRVSEQDQISSFCLKIQGSNKHAHRMPNMAVFSRTVTAFCFQRIWHPQSSQLFCHHKFKLDTSDIITMEYNFKNITAEFLDCVSCP